MNGSFKANGDTGSETTGELGNVGLHHQGVRSKLRPGVSEQILESHKQKLTSRVHPAAGPDSGFSTRTLAPDGKMLLLSLLCPWCPPT